MFSRVYAPRIVSSIMNVFNSTCIHYFFPCNWRAFNSSNNKTKLSHCTMILGTSIKTHACILQRITISMKLPIKRFTRSLARLVLVDNIASKQKIKDTLKVNNYPLSAFNLNKYSQKMKIEKLKTCVNNLGSSI